MTLSSPFHQLTTNFPSLPVESHISRSNLFPHDPGWRGVGLASQLLKMTEPENFEDDLFADLYVPIVPVPLTNSLLFPGAVESDSVDPN